MGYSGGVMDSLAGLRVGLCFFIRNAALAAGHRHLDRPCPAGLVVRGGDAGRIHTALTGSFFRFFRLISNQLHLHPQVEIYAYATVGQRGSSPAEALETVPPGNSHLPEAKSRFFKKNSI